MIYIRADMNDTIATGHIMRCLSIADAARREGEETLFILADEQAAGLLEKRGYGYAVLHTCWDHMDSELPVLQKVIRENDIKKLLIDSYQVTEGYLEKLGKLVETSYIDDLNRFVYPVNNLICYANYWESFHYCERYKNTKLYLGPKYTPLRKEFSDCSKKQVNDRVERLLLLSGGTDPYGILEKLLGEVMTAEYERIDVICGIYYTGFENLCDKYKNYHNIYLHRPVEDLDRYMKAADLAVSAGGTTLYELCAAGTPVISYSIADNQLANVKKFQEDGLIDYAGDVRRDDVVCNVKRYLERYRNDRELRQERSAKMQMLVDGFGAKRIAAILRE